MSPWALQEYLGHKDIRSTGVYVHMIERDITNGFQKAVARFPFQTVSHARRSSL